MIFPKDIQPLLEAFAPDKIWSVGGATRAYILGNSWPEDLDFATTAHPDHVCHLLSNFGLPVDRSAASFGCIRTRLAQYDLEITTLRKDTYTKGSRFPKVQFIQSLEEDAHRRDFTINAIYLTPEGTIIDPLNALKDLRKNKIHFIGNPQKRLKEDPLRLLRYFRFVFQFNNNDLPNLSADLTQALRLGKTLLSSTKTSPARKEKEFNKIKELTPVQAEWLGAIFGQNTASERHSYRAFFSE